MHRLALILSLVAALPAAAQSPRLNVILVSADTLRGDMLGVNGNEEVKTPNLDALAAEGVNFRRAYTNITTTAPSHLTMLSSLYPSDHGIFDNQSKASDEIVTLPEVLDGHGWDTAGIVNMPWMNPDVTGVTQGIRELARGDHVRKAAVTTDWVLRFLGERAKKDAPFFLFVHYTDDHTPYHAPGRYARLYYPDGKDPRAGESGSLQKIWPLFPKDERDNPYVKRWLRGLTDASYVTATYKGSVTFVDRHIGRIVAALKKTGQWDRTLIVFTADHGESLGEHGIWFAHGGLYEPTAHIPLIVRVPEGPKGRQIDTVVDLVDVVPTILGRLGIDPPSGARGEDLWDVVNAASPPAGAALLEHTGRQLIGVVTPRWKYVRHLKTRTDIYPAYAIRRGRKELYDLRADPGETHNLAKENPEKVAELEAVLQRLKGGGHAFKSGRADVDAETEEALRALGYVQ